MTPRSEVPLDELRILRGLAVAAVDMALCGFPGEGYTSLLEGMGRVKLRADDPWHETLLARYRRTLDEYAAMYHVARE